MAAASRPASTRSTMPREVVALGAGEILLTSMDRDGTKSGFDIALTRAIADAVPVPVIASGGVGKLDHLVDGHPRRPRHRGAGGLDLPFRRVSRCAQAKDHMAQGRPADAARSVSCHAARGGRMYGTRMSKFTLADLEKRVAERAQAERRAVLYAHAARQGRRRIAPRSSARRRSRPCSPRCSEDREHV